LQCIEIEGVQVKIILPEKELKGMILVIARLESA